jgi:hypothetical protein
VAPADFYARKLRSQGLGLSHEAGAAFRVNTTVQLNTEVMRRTRRPDKKLAFIRKASRHVYVNDLRLRSQSRTLKYGAAQRLRALSRDVNKTIQYRIAKTMN